MSVAPPGGQDRIMIYGPKSDGTYEVKRDGFSRYAGYGFVGERASRRSRGNSWNCGYCGSSNDRYSTGGRRQVCRAAPQVLSVGPGPPSPPLLVGSGRGHVPPALIERDQLIVQCRHGVDREHSARNGFGGPHGCRRSRLRGRGTRVPVRHATRVRGPRHGTRVVRERQADAMLRVYHRDRRTRRRCGRHLVCGELPAARHDLQPAARHDRQAEPGRCAVRVVRHTSRW
jgi:hypothetical protein